MARKKTSNVVPFSTAFPRGLFAPYLAPPCEHALVPGEPIDLQGLPGPLPTLRCQRCPAIEVLAP